MASGGRDKDKDREESAREAALFDPDSVFHDFTSHSTTGRAVEALTASGSEPAEPEPEPEKSASLYARSEKKRSGALTKEMIQRMADRAEQAAKDKK